MDRPTTWEEGLDEVLADFRALMVDRHSKYGPQNIEMSGELGCEVRALDKLARLRHARENPALAEHDDDTTADAWADMANYGVIAAMLRRGYWALPADCLGGGTQLKRYSLDRPYPAGGVSTRARGVRRPRCAACGGLYGMPGKRSSGGRCANQVHNEDYTLPTTDAGPAHCPTCKSGLRATRGTVEHELCRDAWHDGPGADADDPCSTCGGARTVPGQDCHDRYHGDAVE